VQVSATGAGQATITVRGDKGATATIAVGVTVTDVHVNFSNLPSNAYTFKILGLNGGDSIDAKFLFPGPLHYAFVAYDLAIPVSPSGRGAVEIYLYDQNATLWLDGPNVSTTPYV